MILYRQLFMTRAPFSLVINNTGLKGHSCYSETSRRYTNNVNGHAKNQSTVENPPLVDLLGRKHDYLRISLTERCNLRCQYCMPAEGVPLCGRNELLSRDELSRLVRLFATLGVRKVRLTGGEPTLRADLADVVRELAAIDGIATVAMTSNGVALARRLPALSRAGLSALNLSLDTLREDRYERMARRPGLRKVLACIDLALQLDYRPLKINTVLMKGFNDDEICDFAEFTKDRDIEVRFIEFMPFSGNAWDDARLVPGDEALAALRLRYGELLPLAAPSCGTASLWRVPGHVGRLGFISSMTRPFCGSCNRLRLTADGGLKVCLFGADELSLRDALRAGVADDDLSALVRAALRRKKPQHAAGATARRARAAPAGRRAYCTLTHLDAEGRARMVDVGAKPVTRRGARAECELLISEKLARLLRGAGLAKGDATTVAQVAGALGAKRTADLIPLCHPLPLELARVTVEVPSEAASSRDGRVAVKLACETRATSRTGVEMEALTGCAVAALALYDMCKSVDRHMTIGELRVVSKFGGAGGDWCLAEGAAPPQPSSEKN
ncbi:molybdenum cofactor biosynthesis protein 1 isoform X1 [Pieris rapae]|uniref:molybdenum cofactor biosynthesis protein 1 isoform X1 n=2 Tax=Pieris rapae TaxID=64459 RepID=UPI001E27AB04|nr:molybdenum cofactor biosynthesis protein 1 isoform X1 [Pieris rapae]